MVDQPINLILEKEEPEEVVVVVIVVAIVVIEEDEETVMIGVDHPHVEGSFDLMMYLKNIWNCNPFIS